MTYTKPEVSTLGKASELIENAIPPKSGSVVDHPLPPKPSNPAYDLDE
jgi:hypothetical protein